MVASIIAVIVVAVGTAAPPEMFANKRKSAIVANDIVPEDVIGPPVNPAPVATFVTVPAPSPGAQTGLAAAPCV